MTIPVEWIDAIEKVDYSELFLIIGLYLFILWLTICGWVFADSIKRCHPVVSLFFSLFVILFGPPGLIFYILTRPEMTKEEKRLINTSSDENVNLFPMYFKQDKAFEVTIKYDPENKVQTQMTYASPSDQTLYNNIANTQTTQELANKSNKQRTSPSVARDPQDNQRSYLVTDEHNGKYFTIKKDDTISVKLADTNLKYDEPKYDANILRLNRKESQVKENLLKNSISENDWQTVQKNGQNDFSWSFTAVNRGTSDILIKSSTQSKKKSAFHISLRVE
ncbi:hypothetical protein JW766_01585 [Candidatus Dojkabacteria bacterium]|nr:hypothetical protein [Candidatus Dojkabacteria bacterium]